MFRKVSLLVSVCLVTLSAFAQSTFTLQGTVSDAKTGERLTGATVLVRELSKGTVTDPDGDFKLNLPPSSYTVVISFIGYKTETKTVNLKKNQNLVIALAEDNKQLDEVVISSRRADANVRSVEMSVQKLEMKTIERVPALMGEVDLIKVVQLLPGVTSTGEGTSSFSVRGGSADQNLILLDNSTVYNASHLMGFFSVFNNDAVDKVTLYKGDMPASSGGRLSSLLDVEMRDGSYDGFHAQGGIGTISSRLTVEGPIARDKASFILSGRRTYADVFLKLSPNEDLKRSRLYFYDLNGKISYKINDNNRLYYSGYTGSDVFYNGLFGLQFGNTTSSLKWNHVFNPNFYSNVTLSYSRFNYRLWTNFDNSVNFDWRYDMTDYDLKSDFIWLMNENNTFKFGIEETMHTINPGDISQSGEGAQKPIHFASQNSLEHAVYAMNEQKIGDHVTIKYGVRFSAFQNMGNGKQTILYDNLYQKSDSVVYANGKLYNTYPAWSPRVGIKIDVDAHSSVKASYSRTYQFMQLATTSSSGSPVDLWFTASKNVKPQSCDQYAAGYFRNFFDNKLETSVELFYKDMKNTVDFKNFPTLLGNEQLEGELRYGNSEAYGAEFMLQKPAGTINGWISYTFSRTFRNIKGVSDVDPEAYTRFAAPYDKPHTVSVVLNYKLTQRLEIGALWVYGTGVPITYPVARAEYGGAIMPIASKRNAYRYPDYHRMDLSVTLIPRKNKTRKWQGEWNFSVYNVYGRKNAWAINFIQDPEKPNVTTAQKTYLFSVIPSITYNFKF